MQDEKEFSLDDDNTFKVNSPVAVEMRVSCSKGTYIRTLCNDIGEKLGVYGYMRKLFRSKAGRFTSSTAITLEELEEYVKDGTLDSHVIKPQDVLDNLDIIVVDDNNLSGILNGQKKRISDEYDIDKKYRLFDSEDNFLGVGEIIVEGKSRLLKMYKKF